MHLGRRLPRSFYERPCLEVAPDLVGAYLVRRLADGTRLVGRLVEVEAYLGDGSDPASHSHRGKTPRNHSMFGPPGRLYAYRIYGMHVCINLVCEPRGSGAAVLLRALEPLEGALCMRHNRNLHPGQSDLQIARGPGRLTQALGLGMEFDGKSALRDAVTLHLPESREPQRRTKAIARTRRIGIQRGSELPYRFFIPDCRWVSGPRNP